MEGNWLFLNFPKGHATSHLTSIYKRSHALDVGFYTDDIISSDWQSTLKLIQNNKVGFVNRPVGMWRKHPENASRSFNIDEISRNTAFIEKPYRFAKKINLFPEPTLVVWQNDMLTRYFVKHLTKMAIAESDQSARLKTYIKKNHPKLYYKTTLHPFLLAVKLFSRNPTMLTILFRDILKMESLLIDFAELKNTDGGIG
jgi:hypothetical protein